MPVTHPAPPLGSGVKAVAKQGEYPDRQEETILEIPPMMLWTAPTTVIAMCQRALSFDEPLKSAHG